MSKRVHVDISIFVVMRKMIKVGQQMYNRLDEIKKAAKLERASRQRDGMPEKMPMRKRVRLEMKSTRECLHGLLWISGDEVVAS
eukprot:85186-Karenia_brevis.AAC.1